MTIVRRVRDIIITYARGPLRIVFIRTYVRIYFNVYPISHTRVSICVCVYIYYIDTLGFVRLARENAVRWNAPPRRRRY